MNLDEMTDEQIVDAAMDGDTLLKKPDVLRDSMGRFDRHGKTLAKTAKKTGLIKKPDDIKRGSDGKFEQGHGGAREGAGRPKGSLNKVSKALKDMILASLDRVGGEEYLARLAIENSSAFASLLGKVLPTTLSTSDSDGGASAQITFTRVIVWPDGRREIDGVTPKALPAPDAPTDPTLVTGGDRGRDGGGIG
jgi:hypothetical protein